MNQDPPYRENPLFLALFVDEKIQPPAILRMQEGRAIADIYSRNYKLNCSRFTSIQQIELYWVPKNPVCWTLTEKMLELPALALSVVYSGFGNVNVQHSALEKPKK
ncbi:hypothetical protein [Brevibacillus parabrevis]|uniref:hypothetical protein n=1 Tax=Brevibacillus parabrevis TaxID=54914 RepID=UPI0012F4F4B6|nr:hypothetical protein [Brevibacillus parabrevis]